jgi:uncharacterized protein YdiU (UPF0061 family)
VSVVSGSVLVLDDWFGRDLADLCEPWSGSMAPAPELVVLNEELAVELGLAVDRLRSPEGLAVLSGSVAPPGSAPVAQAYAGHQFGGYSPRLGDGRALLLGELADPAGRRRDVHLKGSGRTPFARGGDGKAALGPMLREHLMGEAMAALGIPTTRSLAVVATGERIPRDHGLVPGAVLVRVAASHIRVGTFQYAAAHGGPDLVRRLADHVIERHHPQARDGASPYLALLDAVVEVQASLVARWMAVGFIHGVMNTDNMTVSGETIDYGPCAFMDAYDPSTVFSSIDHGGRYAYGNQPGIAQWDLARLAEALLPLLGDDVDGAIGEATEVLRTFADRYRKHWLVLMSAKLGVTDADGLADDLLALLQSHGVDMTKAFRSLSSWLRGDTDPALRLFADPAPFEAWATRWSAAAAPDAAASMDRINPLYIPRNHLVEEALAAAETGDLQPFERLVDVLRRPFEPRPGLDRYAEPAPADFGPHQTFCGT